MFPPGQHLINPQFNSIESYYGFCIDIFIDFKVVNFLFQHSEFMNEPLPVVKECSHATDLQIR